MRRCSSPIGMFLSRPRVSRSAAPTRPRPSFLAVAPTFHIFAFSRAWLKKQCFFQTGGCVSRLMVCLACVLGLAVPCAAQDSPGWQFMSDGALFAVVNHQGGPRGADEVPVTNWWMGMPIRPIGSSELRFNTMFSLEPVTAGASGYAELF